jgi:hypothetical protein
VTTTTATSPGLITVFALFRSEGNVGDNEGSSGSVEMIVLVHALSAASFAKNVNSQSVIQSINSVVSKWGQRERRNMSGCEGRKNLDLLAVVL